jgi:hypothetical protein
MEANPGSNVSGHFQITPKNNNPLTISSCEQADNYVGFLAITTKSDYYGNAWQ